MPLSGLNFNIFGKGCVDELDAVKLQVTGLVSVSLVKLIAEFKLAW